MIGWLRRIFPGQARAGSNAGTTRRPDRSDPFIINLYDDRAVVHRPDGQREEIAWDVLERVVVRVSGSAPWAGTAWLILIGGADSGQGCVVPLDAANHAALLERLRALPGFNQQKLDNALRDAAAGKSRSDAICWKRGTPAQAEADAGHAGGSDDAGHAA